MADPVSSGETVTQPANSLRFGQKVGYSIGEIALNFTVAGISNYLLFFYTDVFGIAAGAAGLLMLVGRLWDAVNDPLMGIIVDRTESKWGKYRPYILFGAPPLAIITALTFTTPNLDPTGKLVWAYVTFILWSMAFTAVSIPYNAMMANLTTDSQERASIGSIKTIFAVIGSLLVVVLAKPMTEALGANLQSGYMITFTIFSVLSFLIFMACFKATREKTITSTSIAGNRITFAQVKKTLLKNRPLITLVLFFVLFQIAFSLFRTVELYYFKYVLLRDNLFSVALLGAHIFAIAGMAFTPMAAKKFDKKRASLYGGVIGSVFFLLMYLTPGNVTVALISICLSYFFVSFTYALFFGILPDTVEYGQWKSGIRAAGLIFSILAFTQKFGMAIAAALAGRILEMVGYVPDQVQTATAIHGILVMRTLIPLGLLVAGMIIFLFYNLPREKHQQILNELKIQSSD